MRFLAAFGFVLLFGPAVCFYNLQLACSSSAGSSGGGGRRPHKCHRVGHGVLGLMVLLGLAYVCGGFVLLVAKIDIVSIPHHLRAAAHVLSSTTTATATTRALEH
jgi:triacylglycerol esterase/lipase EstA (alpha/beta hydrolase family)